MNRIIFGLIGGAVVWFAVSAQQPVAATEGVSAALPALNWGKILAALVPVVISVLQGGKFDWKSILSTVLGIKFDPAPTPTPDPPGPSPEPRPILDLFRRLIDALVADGNPSLAKDVIDLAEMHAKGSAA